MIPYREKEATVYLAQLRRRDELIAFRRFKFLFCLFITAFAFAVWFIIH